MVARNQFRKEVCDVKCERGGRKVKILNGHVIIIRTNVQELVLLLWTVSKIIRSVNKETYKIYKIVMISLSKFSKKIIVDLSPRLGTFLFWLLPLHRRNLSNRSSCSFPVVVVPSKEGAHEASFPGPPLLSGVW